MKIRHDFVTNSSSSSFLISNNTDKYMTGRDLIEHLFSKILEDSDNQFDLAPGESIEIECSDSGDCPFEKFIHNQFSGWGTGDYDFNTEGIEIKMLESHH